jgi:hypothetical protein
MAEDILQRSGGDALLDTRHGKGVAQDMGRDGSADMRAVGHLFDHPLNRSDADLQTVMQSQMAFEGRLDTRRQRNHPPFGQLPVGPALPVDHQAVVLPVEVISGEVGQFRHSEPSIQQCPYDQFFFMGLTGVGQPVGFVRGKGLSFVLVAHTPSIAKKVL